MSLQRLLRPRPVLLRVPMKLVVAGRRFAGVASSVRSGGNSLRRPTARTWNISTDMAKSRNRRGPKAIRSMLAAQPGRAAVEQDLPAVPSGHHPRRTIQRRTEVVPVTQLGFASRQAHPHRQLQRPLRGHRRIHRRLRRGERAAHPVAGVLEQEAAVRLDRRAQHLVMRRQGRPHRVGVGLPPTGRTLDVGEQKRHHPRGAAAGSADTHAESHTGQLLPRTSAEMPLQETGRLRQTVQGAGPMPTGLRSRDNGLLGTLWQASQRAVKDGVMWKRTGRLATAGPIIPRTPPGYDYEYDEAYEYRSGRGEKLLGRVESIHHRGYTSTRAAIMATTRPTTSASDDQLRPDSSAHVRDLFQSQSPETGFETNSASLRCGLFRDGVRQH